MSALATSASVIAKSASPQKQTAAGALAMSVKGPKPDIRVAQNLRPISAKLNFDRDHSH
jgi:hypothetical protein